MYLVTRLSFVPYFISKQNLPSLDLLFICILNATQYKTQDLFKVEGYLMT